VAEWMDEVELEREAQPRQEMAGKEYRAAHHGEHERIAVFEPRRDLPCKARDCGMHGGFVAQSLGALQDLPGLVSRHRARSIAPPPRASSQRFQKLLEPLSDL